MSGQPAPRRNKNAEVRRDDVIEASIPEFAKYGLSGSSATRIAGKAGISQPYLFRLFGSKKNLYIAAIDRIFDKTLDHWRSVLQENPERTPMCLLSVAYVEQTENTSLLTMQLQAYASAADPEIRSVVSTRFLELVDFVDQFEDTQRSTTDFLSAGLLINVLVALGIDRSEPLWRKMRSAHDSECEWCAKQDG